MVKNATYFVLLQLFWGNFFCRKKKALSIFCLIVFKYVLFKVTFVNATRHQIIGAKLYFLGYIWEDFEIVLTLFKNYVNFLPYNALN